MSGSMRVAAVVVAALFAVLFVSVEARRGGAAPGAPQSTVPSLPTVPPGPEAITGTPAVSAPGSETPARDPFSPYAIGPAPDDKTKKPSWSYADLSPAEQAVADKGRDTTQAAATNNAFAAAAGELAQRAAANAAAAQLGATDLTTTGVVP